MSTKRFEGNPAEVEGVVTYRPEYDPQLRYNPESKGVVDPISGNKFWLRSAHADGRGEFGLASPENAQLVQGAYYRHGVMLPDETPAMIIDVAATYVAEPGKKDVTFVPFDVGLLAKFLRVQADGEKPSARRSFIVVDSRPVRGLQPMD